MRYTTNASICQVVGEYRQEDVYLYNLKDTRDCGRNPLINRKANSYIRQFGVPDSVRTSSILFLLTFTTTFFVNIAISMNRFVKTDTPGD